MKHSEKLFALFIALTVGSNAAFAQLGTGGSSGGKKPVPPPSPSTAAVAGVLEDAQRAAQNAMAEAQTVYRKFSYDAMTAAMPGAGATLIIPKDAVDAKANAEMEEDLKVMALIIEKATSQDERGRSAMGIKIRNNFYISTSPRNLYIEGYGALFFLNVNMPLLPPPDVAPDSPEKDDTSSEWEAAREELHRPPGTFDFKFHAPSPFPRDVEKYDAAKVEDLKESLISCLKNAAHIRRLKSDESVTIVVTGRESRLPAIKDDDDGLETRPDSERSDSRLIIRARRSDIESLQKGKMTEDDFHRKVSVITF